MIRIVKLGGSLLRSSLLANWITMFTNLTTDYKVVIVPGGGVFAEVVRSAQKHWSFSDSSAHHMALIAMQQYGLLLNDLLANSNIVNTLEEIDQQQNNLLIWCPVQLHIEKQIDMPSSWDYTSDSLALWLAIKMHAVNLYMIKSVNYNGKQQDINQLTIKGLIDVGFAKLLPDYQGRVFFFNKSEHELCHQHLTDEDAQQYD